MENFATPGFSYIEKLFLCNLAHLPHNYHHIMPFDIKAKRRDGQNAVRTVHTTTPVQRPEGYFCRLLYYVLCLLSYFCA